MLCNNTIPLVTGNNVKKELYNPSAQFGYSILDIQYWIFFIFNVNIISNIE